MDELTRWWARMWQPQATPEPLVSLGLAGVAVILVAFRPTWTAVRMLATVCHEGAHALVAVLTGRRLRGIKLHRDTSGVTVSSGPARGPGMVATLAAGYPAPGLVGLAGAAIIAVGYPLGFLGLMTVALAWMLVHIRNLLGLVVVLICGAALAVSVVLSDQILVLGTQLLCWLVLVAAPRVILELFGMRGREAQTSDPAQLRRLTGVPAAVWTALFLLITVATLAGGVWLLLPVEDLLARLG